MSAPAPSSRCAVDDTDAHTMHAEWGEVPERRPRAIAATRARGGRVVSIGTTALRLLESVARDRTALCAWTGETDIFITPGFRFRRRRPAADQLPPAALDAVHAGRGLRRAGAHEGGLCARHARAIPLLFLRRLLFCCGDESFLRTSRHRRRRPARPHRRRRTAPSRRRPSCRSAPPARSRPCCRSPSPRPARRSCWATPST